MERTMEFPLYPKFEYHMILNESELDRYFESCSQFKGQVETLVLSCKAIQYTVGNLMKIAHKSPRHVGQYQVSEWTVEDGQAWSHVDCKDAAKVAEEIAREIGGNLITIL